MSISERQVYLQGERINALKSNMKDLAKSMKELKKQIEGYDTSAAFKAFVEMRRKADTRDENSPYRRNIIEEYTNSVIEDALSQFIKERRHDDTRLAIRLLELKTSEYYPTSLNRLIADAGSYTGKLTQLMFDAMTNPDIKKLIKKIFSAIAEGG